MHGLQKETDLAFFIEKELLQVCVGLYQVILNFSDEVDIKIESLFNHKNSNESLTKENILPGSAISLLRLLGCTVSESSNIGNGTLELKFSNGDLLHIFDSDTGYESYQINSPDSKIIV